MAIFNVTTAVDENNGTGNLSLREAIIAANSTPEDDVINLTGGQVYSLFRFGVNEDAAATGDLDILNNGALTIQTLGGADAVIFGGSIDRVFDVFDGANLTLNNVGIGGGSATGFGNAGFGGGIRIHETATVTLNSSRVSNNIATSFANNGDGGGISNRGLLNINDSVIDGNTRGGIFNLETGVANINRSLIANNEHNDFGWGGIFNAGTLTLNDSIVSNNTAGSVGGIANQGGTLQVNNSLISDNTSLNISGGGIRNDPNSSTGGPGTVVVSNSTIARNSAAQGQGGGIFNSGSLLTVNNSTIADNTASQTGGIFNRSSFSTIVGNQSGIVVLNSTIVADNTTTSGPADIDLVNAFGGAVEASFSLIEDGLITGDLGGNVLGADPLLETAGLQNNGSTTLIPRIDPVTGLVINGGPTQTIALQSNSPAIDAGSNPGNLSFDQRGSGFDRAFNGQVDIGAFELQSLPVDTTLPTIPSGQVFSLPENQADGYVIGAVQASDNVGVTGFEIAGGNIDPISGDQGLFAIDSAGNLALTAAGAASAANDFEIKPDSFLLSITASDDAGNVSAPIDVLVQLTDINDAPVINNQSFNLNENSSNGAVVGEASATDQDDGQTLNYSFLSGNLNETFAVDPTTGEITVNDAAQLDFATNPSYLLTVQVQDNASAPLTDTAQITINLNNVNDAPDAIDDAFTIPLNSNGEVLDVVANDDPVDGDPLTVTEVNGVNLIPAQPISLPSGALVLLNGDNTLSYIPVTNFLGADNFNYTVSDGNGGTDIGAVALNIVGNLAPSGNPDSASVTEDNPVDTAIGNVLTNDTDPENDLLQVQAIDGDGTKIGQPLIGQFGTITLNVDGSYTYTLDNSNPIFAGLNNGQTLTDTFEYTLSDGNSEATSTLTITINGNNDSNSSIVVTEALDDGTGQTPGTLSWAIETANQQAGADVIQLATNVRLNFADDLIRMKPLIDSDLTLEGNNFTISGDNDNNGGPTGFFSAGTGDRPILFVKSGQVQLKNLTLKDGVADATVAIDPGIGGSNLANGLGSGMGGALFIYGGNVTAQSVTFDDNRAIGSGFFRFLNLITDHTGNGGGIGLANDDPGFSPGALGIPLANGGAGGFGSAGGAGSSGISNSKAFGDGRDGGAGGFGAGGGSGGRGGDIAFGSKVDVGNGGNGGNGGFGGGGGQGGLVGDSDAFDTGKFGFYGDGGDGGFGAAGGNTFLNNAAANFGGTGGIGGFGGDNGTVGTGGFIAIEGSPARSSAMGGAIFIRSGTLTITNSTFSNNRASGGSTSSFGGAIFALTNEALQNHNGSNQGLPSQSELPSITIADTNFTNNTARIRSPFSITPNDIFGSPSNLTLNNAFNLANPLSNQPFIENASATNSQTGTGQNGPIANAIVFFDSDADALLDAQETATRTDEQGNFDLGIPLTLDTNGNGQFDLSEGQLALVSGTDITTGLKLLVPLTALPESTMITPLTTLQVALVRAGLSAEEAQSLILSAFNLPDGVDLQTFDPAAATLANQPEGAVVLSNQAAVQAVITQLTRVLQTVAPPDDLDAVPTVTNAIVAELVNQIQVGSVDLSDATQIQTLISNTIANLLAQDSNLDFQVVSDNIVALAQVVAASAAQILAATIGLTGQDSIDALAKAKFIAQAAVTDDLLDLVGGGQTSAQVVAENTGGNLIDQIQQAVLPKDTNLPNAGILYSSLSLADVVGQPLTDSDQALFKAAFGLEESIDLATFNPLVAAAQGDITGVEVLTQLLTTQIVVVQIGALLQGALPDESRTALETVVADTLFGFIQKQVSNSEIVDFADTNQLQTLLSNVVDALLQLDSDFDLKFISDNLADLVQVILASTQQALATDDVDTLFDIRAVALDAVAPDLTEAVAGTQPVSEIVADNTGAALAAQIAAAEANVEPVALDDSFATDTATAISGNVLADNGLAADTDFDGNPLSVIAVNGNATDIGTAITLASGASLLLDVDGDFTYTPALGFVGDDSFTYEIDDGNGVTDTANVTVSVAPSSTDPVFIDTLNSDVGDNNVLVVNGTGELNLGFTVTSPGTGSDKSQELVAIAQNTEITSLLFTLGEAAGLPKGFDLSNITTVNPFVKGSFEFALQDPETGDLTPLELEVNPDGSGFKLPGLGIEFTANPTAANPTDFITQSDNLGVEALAADTLIGAAGSETVNLDFTLFREAGYKNFVGFYAVDALTGAVLDSSGNAIADMSERATYLQAALDNTLIELTAPKNGESRQIAATLDFSDAGLGSTNVELLPYLIANGTPDKVKADFRNLYTSVAGMNSDNTDHIRRLGTNVFGFEDLFQGGDNDFDDMVLQIALET